LGEKTGEGEGIDHFLFLVKVFDDEGLFVEREAQELIEMVGKGDDGERDYRITGGFDAEEGVESDKEGEAPCIESEEERGNGLGFLEGKFEHLITFERGSIRQPDKAGG